MAFGRLLAEAVNRYAAELEQARAPAATRAAVPLARRRAGGVMAVADEGGAAGAGTSGRPWVLSRVHERGDQRMRKVVTGEQVAQMHNRDPFARPIWRAPVYQTPAGIILVGPSVPAAGLAGPPDRPAPAGHQLLAVLVAHLGRSRLGRPHRLATWAVVVLAAWR